VLVQPDDELRVRFSYNLPKASREVRFAFGRLYENLTRSSIAMDRLAWA